MIRPQGDTGGDHGRREVLTSEYVVTRPCVLIIIELVVIVLDSGAPNGQNFDWKGRAGRARVSPMVIALAQEALAVESSSGHFGDVVADLCGREGCFASRGPVARLVATEADGVVSWFARCWGGTSASCGCSRLLRFRSLGGRAKAPAVAVVRVNREGPDGGGGHFAVFILGGAEVGTLQDPSEDFGVCAIVTLRVRGVRQ